MTPDPTVIDDRDLRDSQITSAEVLDDQDESVEQAAVAVPVLTEPREGVPDVIADHQRLAEAAERIFAGTGPIAVDAERASGYRYGQRAYLIQVRRQDSGTFLIDPIECPDLSPLAESIADCEWVLHAASQDLPCLREVGLSPAALFDTELAGRLLGYPRVGLSALLEDILGVSLAKEHSAADWSTRPLPEPWLRYAALDVELLIELRDAIEAELRAAGKYELAMEEFEAVRTAPAPAPRVDPWRRTSGLHKIRRPRQLAVVRELWLTRDSVAQRRDVSPGRVLQDAALIAAAAAYVGPTPPDLSTLPAFTTKGAKRHLSQWQDAVDRVGQLTDAQLPASSIPSSGPPPARSWPDKDPVAAMRLAQVKDELARISERESIPVENLMTPDLVRRVLWSPPFGPDCPQDEQMPILLPVLRDGGARPWQISLVADVLVRALTYVPDLNTPET